MLPRRALHSQKNQAFNALPSLPGRINCPKSPQKGQKMLHIIWSIILGFIIGLIARAIMPGAHDMGFIATSLVGIVGSVVGGFVARLFSKPKEGQPIHPAGLIMSVIGAMIVLFILSRLG